MCFFFPEVGEGGKLLFVASASLPSGQVVRRESESQALTLYANEFLVGEASVLSCWCDKEEPHYLAINKAIPQVLAGPGQKVVFLSRTEQAVQPQGLAMIALRRIS